MTKPVHSVSVAAVITDASERVLVVQRRDNGKWEIPGGILELDESIQAGLRREVLEETGLVVAPQRLTGVYKNLRLRVVALVFRASILAGEPGPTEEAAAVDWWTPATVKTQMAEIFAVRVHDALTTNEPAIRVHNGIHLLGEDAATSTADR